MPLTLFRRGKSRTFYYRGTVGPTGNRKNLYGSCHTTNKDLAARQAAEVEARYWKGNFDGAGAILTFAQAAGFSRAGGRSDRFLTKIEKHLGNTLVKDITPGAVTSMAIKLYPNCSGASLNRLVIGPVTAVINYAAESGLCSPIRIKRFKVETKIKEPATLEWVQAFAAHAAPHLGAYAMFMYFTGARPSEALGIEWADVDLTDDRSVLIRESKVGKERRADLPPELIVAMANVPKVAGRPVFVYRLYNDLGLAWDAAIKRAGIKRLTPHCCRHGFATGLLRRGVDVVTVARLGGWATPSEVFKTYGHAAKERRITDILSESERAPAVQATSDSARNQRKTGTT